MEDRMATNLAIDDELLKEAQKISGIKTKKDTRKRYWSFSAVLKKGCPKKGSHKKLFVFQ
jgi:hypothetical protein